MLLADFTGTLGMSGLAAASLIASASLRSFLPRRTNGFTYLWAMMATGEAYRGSKKVATQAAGTAAAA